MFYFCNFFGHGYSDGSNVLGIRLVVKVLGAKVANKLAELAEFESATNPKTRLVFLFFLILIKSIEWKCTLRTLQRNTTD